MLVVADPGNATQLGRDARTWTYEVGRRRHREGVRVAGMVRRGWRTDKVLWWAVYSSGFLEVTFPLPG